MAERLVRTGLALLHPADDTADVAGDVQLAGLPCAGGIENVGIAHLVQLFDGGSLGIQADLCAVGLHKGDIAVNGLVRDAERRDDMADDAAELAGALEDGAGYACAAEEVGRSNAGRAAADDGSALAGNGSRADDGCHSGIDALLGRQQLGCTDLDRIFIEVAGALAHAAVRADRAGDERQGVALRDEGQRLVIQALAAQLEILGDVLRDGAAAAAGGGVAIEPGYLFLGLARGQRLDGLAVVRVRAAGGGQGRNGLSVRAVERAERHAGSLFGHLGQAVVAARLQNGRGDGDGPDPGRQQLVAVEEVCAARERDLHLTAELRGDAAAHFDGQREQGAAGHVHLVVRQLAARRVDRERVRQLQAELQLLAVRQRLQALKHRDGVLPLQILIEMVIVEDDVIIAH